MQKKANISDTNLVQQSSAKNTTCLLG